MWLPGGQTAHPYSDRLAQHLERLGAQLSVVNAGVNGEETSSMVQRLQLLLDKRDESGCGGEDFEFVLILGGTNDLCKVNRCPEDIVRNLWSMHDTAHRAGLKTGALTLPYIHTWRLEQEVNADRVKINERLCDFVSRQKERSVLVDVAAKIPQDTEHMLFGIMMGCTFLVMDMTWLLTW